MAVPGVGVPDDAQRGRFEAPRYQIDGGSSLDAILVSAARAPANVFLDDDDINAAAVSLPLSTAVVAADVDLPAPGAVDVAALAAAQPMGPDVRTLAAMGLRPLRTKRRFARPGAGSAPQGQPQLSPPQPHQQQRQPPQAPQQQPQQPQQQPLSLSRQPPPRTVSSAARRQHALRLHRAKQEITDRFRHWHQGMFHWAHWSGRLRGGVIRTIPVPPRQGRWPGFSFDPARSPSTTPKRERIWAQPPRRGGAAAMARAVRSRIRGLDPKVRRARRDPRVAVAGGLQRQLAADFRPAGWEVKRRLGMGGFGAVFLLNMIGENGVKVPIVVKGGLRVEENEANMEQEKYNLDYMAGAQHFIQRVILADLPLPMTARSGVRRFISRHLNAAFSRLGLGNSSPEGPRSTAFAPVTGGAGVRPRNPVAVALAGSLRSRSTEYDAGIGVFGGGASSSSYGSGASSGTSRRRAISSSPRRRIISRALRRRPPASRPDPGEDILLARLDLDAAQDTILLENMARGSVHDLLVKLAKGNLRLSDRMLWLIFECLFRGCLAMAFPAEYRTPDSDPTREMLPLRQEVVPERYRGGLAPLAPMVHFDLDPHNGLIGDYGPPGSDHEFVPIVKIADPGLAHLMTPQLRANELWNWFARESGKASNFHPEQFTSEWEYEAAISGAHLAREPTAANYNWWSNLYQVGWIMWSLVTRCYPPWPPVPKRYEYADESPGAAPGSTVTGWSYGTDLAEASFDGYDETLRRQIYRCLDHNAVERPKADWLEQVIEFNVRRDDLIAAESDEELREAAKIIFGDP